MKQISLSCDMFKFFRVIKRAVKKNGLDICFQPNFDISLGTNVATTAPQRDIVRGELYTILSMVCGGQALLVIEGVGDDDGAEALTALWKQNTAVCNRRFKRFRKEVCRKYGSISSRCFTTDCFV